MPEITETPATAQRRAGCGRDNAPGLFAVGLVLVVVAGLTTFPPIAPYILFSWDSATYVTNAQEYFADGTLTGLIASYTQSFGNLAYTLNFNLLPEAKLAFAGGRINPVVMYLLASALFYVTAFTLASIVGFSAVVAVVSGLIFVLLTMPVTSPPLYSIIFWWHSPYAIPLVYMFAALFVTVHFIGRLGVAGNVLAIAVLALETFWIIVGGAKAGVIVLLGAGLLSIALVTSSGSAKSLAWKIAGGVVVLLFLAAPGPLHYIRGCMPIRRPFCSLPTCR